MNIIQIVPRIPPVVDGVGDYAIKLADGLRKNYGILSHFLTCQDGFKPSPVINGFPVTQLPTQNTLAFLDSLPKSIDKIILHYSESYDLKFGAPFWLLEALKAARQQRNFKLLIMFHEFPHLNLWRKRSFEFPLQRFVAWRVAKLADIVLTNNSVYQNTLTRGLNSPVISIPVFSNIGESEYILPLNKRSRRLVVFGTSGRRWKIYKRAQAMLRNTCRLLEIEEIFDVGPSLNLKIPEIKGVRLVEMGEKSAQDISNLMLDSLAGIAYSNNNGHLAKSGVFASYCAHGLVPVITQAKSSQADGLESNKNFIFAGARSTSIDILTLENVANQAHEWYRNHSLAKTVEVFASQLLGNAFLQEICSTASN
ncbi:MAG: hypothetical protein LDL41_07670 [Coleofasciculus sp. S288]|nr:hypothetical protein [Coleofasciculus sp. S288]